MPIKSRLFKCKSPRKSYPRGILRLKGMQIVISTAFCIAAITPLTGCDWSKERKEVLKILCEHIKSFREGGMDICREHPTTEGRTECLKELARAHQVLSLLKGRQIVHYDNCSEKQWDTTIGVITGILQSTGEALTKNLGNLVSSNGIINIEAVSLFVGNEYVLQPGSVLAIGSNGEIIEISEATGKFKATIVPNGNGGVSGTVDEFDMSFELEDEPMNLWMTSDHQPGELAIDSTGNGTMTFHAFLYNESLGSPLLWVELPINSTDPTNSITISTDGPVPFSDILPVFEFGSEGDCNSNGIANNLDLQEGTSGDCDLNGIPDECQLGGHDCNGNEVLDKCDIVSGTSLDLDANDFPDECETFDPLQIVGLFPSSIHIGDLFELRVGVQILTFGIPGEEVILTRLAGNFEFIGDTSSNGTQTSILTGPSGVAHVPMAAGFTPGTAEINVASIATGEETTVTFEILPPWGACCISQFSCIDEVEQDICEINMSGSWNGIGSRCLDIDEFVACLNGPGLFSIGCVAQDFDETVPADVDLADYYILQQSVCAGE